MPGLATIAAIIAAVAFVSFGAGYAVESWHLGKNMEKLKGENTLLIQANDRCAGDIANAKTAMQQILTDTRQREQQAADAMQKAQPQVEQRQAVITKIKSKPEVALNMQCEAIKLEQIEYVKGRKGE